MTKNDSVESMVDSYLERVRTALHGLPERQIEDILRELRAHAIELAEGKGIDVALTSLGDPVELATVVASAVEGSRPLIEARRHDLQVDLPAEPVRVQGDLTRLAQVVLNLLNNSAKYTPEGGPIRLAVGTARLSRMMEHEE